MRRTYLCDTSRMALEIRKIIQAYIGVVADVVDICEAIGACFEIIVAHRVVTKPKLPTEYFTDMGVPTDPAKRAVDLIMGELTCFVKQTVGSSEKLSFEYRVLDLDEFMMIADDAPRIEMVTSPTIKEDVLAKLKSEVSQGLSNGDWYSERMRQLVGLT